MTGITGINALDARSVEIPIDDVPRNYLQLLEAAKALQPEQIDEMEAIVAQASMLTPMRQDAVFKAVKAATGTPIGAMREQISKGGDSEGVDDLDLARSTISTIGRENIICTGGDVWR